VSLREALRTSLLKGRGLRQGILAVVAFLATITCLSSSSLAADDLAVLSGISDAADRAQIAARFRAAGYGVATLDAAVDELATNLLADIDRGEIGENGSERPAHLADFSNAIAIAIPGVLNYKRVHVVSRSLLPIELAFGEGGFVGDRVVVSHVFHSRSRATLVPTPQRLPLGTYVIEAVIGMPEGMRRADQDIVQVALALENRFPVELHFGGGRDNLERVLARRDVGILHIDTHGGERGDAIQISRAGDMLRASALPRRIGVPVVLLFGCEGLADASAFGSVLHHNGAQAVISAFAKFQSFGLTGDADSEKRIYEAFFEAVVAGEDIGTALLRLRQSAIAGARDGSRRTLTRLLFVLLGNDRLILAAH
jgi:hypothetical protein